MEKVRCAFRVDIIDQGAEIYNPQVVVIGDPTTNDLMAAVAALASGLIMQETGLIPKEIYNAAQGFLAVMAAQPHFTNPRVVDAKQEPLEAAGK